MAEVAGQFVKAGSQLFIAGRLQTDTWEDAQSGEKRSKTKVVATDLILLDPKSGQLPEPSGATQINGACNRADVIGNVTRDPEMRTTTNGHKVLTLGVASNDRWKDKTSGEMKEKSEFHNVVVWGPLAEEVSAHVKKGSKVFVSGRVQTRSWETQSGAKRYTTEIVTETFTLLGLRSKLAEESVSSDVAIRRPSLSADATDQSPVATNAPSFGSDPTPALAAVPDIQYGSEIKVEDLPF
jgi:single-strand DNA-binding protein